ncbi:MAG: cell division protein FtsQ/DivIB [Pseudomonadota bacterium]|nr:cell division protein FtsQ/DivIB [Pseudomonadota bacterium]
MTNSLPVPVDVRLMNLTASLLVAGLVLACVAAGLWWVLRNPAFAIRQIVVAGDTTHNSAASLRATVAPRLAGNFFTLDLAAAQSAFQSAPWVRKAVVRREFPGRLSVTLQEHTAVARWGQGDTHLVNSHGEVFEAPGGNDPGDEALPALQGPDGQAAQVLDMHRQLNPLVAPLDTDITQLALQARGNWRAELGSGAVVELGHGSERELAARLRQFAATVKEVAARHQRGVEAVEAADLRHPGGYALRLRGVTTVRPDPQAAPAQRR